MIYPSGPCFDLQNANEAEVIAFSSKSCLGNVYKNLGTSALHFKNHNLKPRPSADGHYYLSGWSKDFQKKKRGG